ncbi:MAG TPA: preprotein translocase subunit SecE [Bacteroidia bacterium]|jgi:preprotein translocase subunit SecE|nr:preprotein translocase subunit SecE [Bacteroidia bacterium]MBP9181124.1 preprotein translocase subunit SecE [Bacteroidia bacterium]MBP9725316.1 preprotein translocase subunit SecE [Bacteroidia bacterium]HLP31956.1 preprotein translocase subunit SecE [Bacteroidia bacterium]
MEKLINYFKSTTEELMTKVSWPTWDELQSSTLIVMVASIIFAIIIYLIDLVSSFGLGVFYKLFEG